MNQPPLEDLIDKLAVMAWNHDGEQKDTLLRAITRLACQEPVKPTREVFGIFCGDCEEVLQDDYVYCPKCGRVVKWDD